jgi:hypothetical protein
MMIVSKLNNYCNVQFETLVFSMRLMPVELGDLVQRVDRKPLQMSQLPFTMSFNSVVKGPG